MVRLVVMAAGQASRMGKDKLELDWNGTTILGHVLDTVLEACARLPHQVQGQGVELVVIARQPMEKYLEAPQINRFRAAGGSWLNDPAPRPLAETIKLGLKNISNKALGIGFIPGDQIGLTAEVLASILSYFLVNTPDFLVPTADGVSGSPVFFHSKYIPELLELQGEQGGKQVLKRFPERLTLFPVKPGDFNDIDTPEEYHCLQKQIRDTLS